MEQRHLSMRQLKEMTPEVSGKMRQFKRTLMSYGDFKHARLVADYVLDEHLHAKYPDGCIRSIHDRRCHA
jgi:hypothetical protein